MSRWSLQPTEMHADTLRSCIERLHGEANRVAQKGGEEGPVGALWLDRAAAVVRELLTANEAATTSGRSDAPPKLTAIDTAEERAQVDTRPGNQGGVSMRATGEKPDLVGRASGMAGSRPVDQPVSNGPREPALGEEPKAADAVAHASPNAGERGLSVGSALAWLSGLRGAMKDRDWLFVEAVVETMNEECNRVLRVAGDACEEGDGT